MTPQRLIATLTILLFSVSAEAGHFNYSYTFYDGTTVNGSFTGDVNGQLVDNVSDISAFYEGIEFNGSPNLYAFTDQGTWVHTAPILSFNGNLNNFLFIDSLIIDATLYTNYFVMDNRAGPAARVLVNSLCILDYGCGPMEPQEGHFDASRWTLTQVPEPATLALVGLGLAGLGFSRRKQ